MNICIKEIHEDEFKDILGRNKSILFFPKGSIVKDNIRSGFTCPITRAKFMKVDTDGFFYNIYKPTEKYKLRELIYVDDSYTGYKIN